MRWLLLIRRLILWLFSCRTICCSGGPSCITGYVIIPILLISQWLHCCLTLMISTLQDTSNFKILWALILFDDILECWLLNKCRKLVEAFTTALYLVNVERDIQITYIQRFLAWWILYLQVFLSSIYRCNSLQWLVELAHFGI